MAATSLGVVVAVALVDTTGLLAGGGKATGLTVLERGTRSAKLAGNTVKFRAKLTL